MPHSMKTSLYLFLQTLDCDPIDPSLVLNLYPIHSYPRHGHTGQLGQVMIAQGVQPFIDGYQH